jgi:hypothetical protein
MSQHFQNSKPIKQRGHSQNRISLRDDDELSASCIDVPSNSTSELVHSVLQQPSPNAAQWPQMDSHSKAQSDNEKTQPPQQLLYSVQQSLNEASYGLSINETLLPLPESHSGVYSNTENMQSLQQLQSAMQQALHTDAFGLSSNTVLLSQPKSRSELKNVRSGDNLVPDGDLVQDAEPLAVNSKTVSLQQPQSTIQHPLNEASFELSANQALLPQPVSHSETQREPHSETQRNSDFDQSLQRLKSTVQDSSNEALFGLSRNEELSSQPQFYSNVENISDNTQSLQQLQSTVLHLQLQLALQQQQQQHRHHHHHQQQQNQNQNHHQQQQHPQHHYQRQQHQHQQQQQQSYGQQEAVSQQPPLTFQKFPQPSNSQQQLSEQHIQLVEQQQPQFERSATSNQGQLQYQLQMLQQQQQFQIGVLSSQNTHIDQSPYTISQQIPPFLLQNTRGLQSSQQRMATTTNAPPLHNMPRTVVHPSKKQASLPMTQQVSKEEMISSRKREPTFPLKLHQILSNPGYQGCITWLPHGNSFRVINQELFSQIVLPLHFKHSRLPSFMRQVNGT